MSEVLLNQKEASKRKELRSIQKQSKREYGRGTKRDIGTFD